MIVQRYVELHGRLKRVLSVVKVRNSSHSHDLRFYEVTDAGIEIAFSRPQMDALLTGHPKTTASS